MNVAREASAAGILVALTLWLQCAGMAILIHLPRIYILRGANGLNPWRAAVLMVQFTGLTIILHLLQILLWAAFYRWHGVPSWESCFYFSAGSYSTAGSGEVLLPRMWRSFGPLESIVGVLMCGVSVSVLLAIATRLVAEERKSTQSA